MALLEVRGLEKWYGRRQVVNGVDFEVNRGEVVGLLGPNGAGKTTSFRMTIGLITADGGHVTFDGKDVTNLPMYQRARAGMGYLAQDSSVFKLLSVEDNLMAILETRPGMNRRQRRERQDELLDQFGLTKIRRTKANRVSGGERRRLEIARSLITEPKLIMLDEPFAGIDPKTVAEIQDQIRGLVETYHIGILLTDHQFRETVQVSDRIYVIREGRVFAYGNREQIVNNADVRRHYIGERYDVGHLLDERHVHAIADDATGRSGYVYAPAPESPTSMSLPMAQESSAGEAAGSVPIASSNPTTPMAVAEAALLAVDYEENEEVEEAAEPSRPMPAKPIASAPAEDDFERFFASSVTVQGDVIFEQVDVETEPLDDDEDDDRTGYGSVAY